MSLQEASAEDAPRRKRKPQRELPKLAEELGLITAEQSCGPLTCELCGVSIDGIKAFKVHCAGRKHISNLQRHAKAMVSTSSAQSKEKGPEAAEDASKPSTVTKAASPSNPTFVGHAATSREYCNQVRSRLRSLACARCGN